MIKKIKIYNRFCMDNFARTGGLNFPYTDKLWHLISIYGDGDGELLTDDTKEIFSDLGCKHFLSLNFWDITNQVDYPSGILFHKGQAKKVIAMIKTIQEEKEDSILVAHCQAGISRSGAIGTFACDYCGLDYGEFLKENPYIMSNPQVLRLLRNEAGMNPTFEWHDGIDPYEPKPGEIIFR